MLSRRGLWRLLRLPCLFMLLGCIGATAFIVIELQACVQLPDAINLSGDVGIRII